MNITYKQMQKEDNAKVTPLFIEYWNGRDCMFIVQTAKMMVRA